MQCYQSVAHLLISLSLPYVLAVMENQNFLCVIVLSYCDLDKGNIALMIGIKHGTRINNPILNARYHRRWIQVLISVWQQQMQESYGE